MSFAGASFAETPFASQGALEVRVFATGFGITTTLGTQSVVAVGSPVVIATGFEMAMAFGATGVAAGGNSEVTVQSIPITATLGIEQVDASVTKEVAGFGMTGTIAGVAVIPQGLVQVTGIPITMYANTATAIAQQNQTVVTTGLAMTGTIASVTAQGVATVIPGSLIAQLDLGTGSVIDLSANVPLVGINIEADEGTLAPIGWTIVDDSSTMVWQKAAQGKVWHQHIQVY